MLDWTLAIGACFWLPPVFWIALVLWARFVAYPISLKKWIRRGKTWCYVPEWWSRTAPRNGTRLCLLLLALAAALSTSATVYWILGGFPLPLFALCALACLFAEKLLAERAMDGVYHLELNAYFLEYRHQGESYEKSGSPLSDEDLRGRAAWAFRRSMRNAEGEKRLFKHLKEMSAKEVTMEREEAAHESA